MQKSKIIIVDDEIKIVQLIEVLVDWKNLPLELVGTANDGISALELIKTKAPDIVILDMKMPGFNGIELICRSKELNPEIHFIIISGYKRFEYAQSAIKYGVEDYLLKPVKEDELNSTLKKVIEKIEHKIFNIDIVEHYVEVENRVLEENFFKSLLKTSSTKLNYNDLKSQYNIVLPYNTFEIILIKNDLNTSEINNNEIVLLQEKTEIIIRRIFDCDNSTFYKYRDNNGCYILINYSSDMNDHIREKLILIIEQLHSIHDLFRNLKTTIARSGGFYSLEQIYEMIQSVSLLIQDRVIRGCGKLLQDERSTSYSVEIKDIFPQTIKNLLIKSIEILDANKVKKVLDDIQMDILSVKQNIRGKVVFDITEEILETFFFVLKNRSCDIKLLENNFNDFKEVLLLQSSISSLFSLLSTKIIEIILYVKKTQKEKIAQPIVDVKKYINENFFMNLTLDDVSSFVGMNPTYFSTLFKKETGTGFLEYLTVVRMEEAKELLSDPKRLISDTASEVGYKDTKHFTKQFKKVVGLSPIEYRKIYY